MKVRCSPATLALEISEQVIDKALAQDQYLFIIASSVEGRHIALAGSAGAT